MITLGSWKRGTTLLEQEEYTQLVKRCNLFDKKGRERVEIVKSCREKTETGKCQ